MAAVIYDCRGGFPVFTQKTIATTPTRVLDGGDFVRRTVTIYNAGSVTVYVDNDNTVATGSGFPIAAGDYHVIINGKVALWAVVASATGDLRIASVDLL